MFKWKRHTKRGERLREGKERKRRKRKREREFKRQKIHEKEFSKGAKCNCEDPMSPLFFLFLSFSSSSFFLSLSLSHSIQNSSPSPFLSTPLTSARMELRTELFIHHLALSCFIKGNPRHPSVCYFSYSLILLLLSYFLSPSHQDRILNHGEEENQ